MFETVLQGFNLFFTIQNLLLIFLGVGLGITIGAIPGLTATMAFSLLLPVTFVLPPVPSVAFLMGIYKGATFGGSISAILIRAPGTPGSAATIFDGYPLVQQGKGGKALGMALYSSVIGDVLSDLMLIFSAGALAAIALKAGPVEFFSLIVLSMTIVGSITGESMIKGLIAAALGLMIGIIGVDPLQGVQRFTFGVRQLSAGMSFLPMLIGLFAVSEVITQAEVKFKEVLGLEIDNKVNPSDSWVTWAEIKSCMKTILRSTGIGTFCGAVPGVGTTAAAFLAYGAAQRASKDPDQFGKGSLEGVAAAEAANNAVCGANLIPLLTLGIPGSMTAAILVGAFLIQGLPIGPLIFTTHAHVVYGIYFSLILANMANLFVAPHLIKVALMAVAIRKDILFPIIMVTCVVGSYAWNHSLFDVNLMFIFGIIGYGMRKLGFSVVPFLIAFILGPIGEKALREAMVIHKGDISIFITRPISLLLLLLTVLSIILIVYVKTKKKDVKAL